ncbi:MAG: dihydroorotate dehydrogenase [Bacillota bacterium]
MENKPSLAVEICGVKFKNPCIAASGTFGFGEEYQKYFPLNKLGGISVKGLTLLPRAGNPPPRIAETPSGMLNSVGLQNPGAEVFLSGHLPRLIESDTVVIANIAGNTIEDYCAMADTLSKSAVHMLELNISCPNVKEGGVAFGTRPGLVLDVTRQVKAASGDKPLIVKLSPNTADIRETAKAAEEGGADALSLINTITGMMVDVKTMRPILANVTGGLSGPAILPVALRMVFEACQAVDIPVIGMGGIMRGEDAAAFMLCGARAFMVGTANIVSPTACVRILSELERYLMEQGISDINALVGALKV